MISVYTNRRPRVNGSRRDVPGEPPVLTRFDGIDVERKVVSAAGHAPKRLPKRCGLLGARLRNAYGAAGTRPTKLGVAALPFTFHFSLFTFHVLLSHYACLNCRIFPSHVVPTESRITAQKAVAASVSCTSKSDSRQNNPSRPSKYTRLPQIMKRMRPNREGFVNTRDMGKALPSKVTPKRRATS